MSKTIPEMFSQSLSDRCNPTQLDIVKLDVLSYNERCSSCGADTIIVDLPRAHGKRVCVNCLFNWLAEVGWADPEKIQDLQNDIERLHDKIEDYQDTISDQDRSLESAEARISELDEEIRTKTHLVDEITAECDALRRRVDEFDDDALAIRNENARLKLDLQKMRTYRST